MNISFHAGNSGYTGCSTGSKQYKDAEKKRLEAVMAEEARMTPEQKMLYELLGGREAHMKNVMRNFNSDGDFIGPGGIVVPGMYHGEDGAADRSAMYAAVKAVNPKWEPGQPFDSRILDSVTRESVESTLVKSGNTFVKRASSGGSFDMQI